MNENRLNQFPKTFDDLLLLKTEDFSFSATWRNYLSIIESAAYNMEFDDDIIYPKAFDSDKHATLTVNVIANLVINFKENPVLNVRASNRPIYI